MDVQVHYNYNSFFGTVGKNQESKKKRNRVGLVETEESKQQQQQHHVSTARVTCHSRAALANRLQTDDEVRPHLGDGCHAQTPLELVRARHFRRQHRTQRVDLVLQLSVTSRKVTAR